MNPNELSRKQQLEYDRKAQKSFWFFVENIFSESFKPFVGGEHVKKTCDFLEKNPKTARISAKDHFKSTSLYAHFAWLMWRFRGKGSIECHYFSYERNMAAYHLRKLKDLLSLNPWFASLEDLKKRAESIIKYSWTGDPNEYILKPHGMLAFKRGIHCAGVYVDDPFQDPENKLDPVKVKKINRIFVTQIMDMPSKNGFLHVVGTPQTNKDFFFDDNIMSRFEVLELPAITNFVNKEVLWKEHMPWEELIKRKQERGTRIFNQEYLCKPFSEEFSWFKRERIMKCVDSDLVQQHYAANDNIRTIGVDVGKKVHPTHAIVFELKDDNRWTTVYHEFMDKTEYKMQVHKLNDIIDCFNINYGWYDATRGEFEGFEEQGLLSRILKPVKFTSRSKFKWAANFDRIVTENRIVLPNDDRLISQIMAVDSNLDAVESKDGHGESFWSIALALQADAKLRKKREPVLKTVIKKRPNVREKVFVKRHKPLFR